MNASVNNAMRTTGTTAATVTSVWLVGQVGGGGDPVGGGQVVVDVVVGKSPLRHRTAIAGASTLV